MTNEIILYAALKFPRLALAGKFTGERRKRRREGKGEGGEEEREGKGEGGEVGRGERRE